MNPTVFPAPVSKRPGGLSCSRAAPAWLVAICLVLPTGSRADIHSTTVATAYGARSVVIVDRNSKISRTIGHPGDIELLLGRLMAVVGSMTRYDAEVALPVIRPIPLGELHDTFCSGPCTIRAAYVPGEALFYDAAMQPLSNRYHQSILFHELVHHVQAESGSHEGYGECGRWRDREIEAYALQNRFLFSVGTTRRVLYPRKICASRQAGSGH